MSRNARLSSIEKVIKELVKYSDNQIVPIKIIEETLAINSGKERKRLNKAINRLINKNVLQKQGNKIIYINKNDRKTTEKQAITGKITITQRGAGYVIVDELDEDIMIPPEKTGLALEDDTVAVEIIGQKSSGQPKGKVLKVISRGREFYVGTLKKSKADTYLIETDLKSAHTDFFVLEENLNGAKHDDKVIFKLLNWVHPMALPEAEITSILGKVGTNDANILSILAENGLIAEFPPEVEKYADEIPLEIPKAEYKRRKDCRDIVTFSIDPADAKDFDDALSIEILPNGNFYLGVHIADVSHYVTPGSLLDEEAYNRGVTIYLVDRVIPMLPEKLSNGVCSLLPSTDKLTYSCFMEIDSSGKLIDYTIEETIIRSSQKLSYKRAQEILDTGEKHELDKELKTLSKLAQILLDKRFEEGAINFETREAEFVLDENGKPLDVVVRESHFTHKLIEECMLMANRTVAFHIEKMRDNSGQKKSKNTYPFIYRIHDKPDYEKLGNIVKQVSPLGIKFKVDDNISPKKINDLLKQVKNSSVETIVNELMLRAMAKAEYAPGNIGHFGLGFKYYSHFTSPIRRYPDIIAHRLLKAYSNGKFYTTYEDLVEKGKHTSERERNAIDAERDSVKLKQVEFLSDKIGKIYDGVISGVTDHGLYVTLKDVYCEGMVRIADVKGDYYIYNEQIHGLVGRKSGKTFQLGDDMKVRVHSTNLQRRQIDFVPV